MTLVDGRTEDPRGLIVRIAQTGDREAFAQLFTLFAPRVKSYLLGLGTPPQAAEELAQEALLTVWRKAAVFDPARAGAATWIFTIARNLRIDAARRDRSALSYALNVHDEPEPIETPAEATLSSDNERHVAEAMRGLSEEQREVVRLSFFQDKAHSEIATELGIPLGTVKSRVRLALARLRDRLEALS
jgi:RNA polymerase sigma-70 factor (ECF subfamily)